MCVCATSACETWPWPCRKKAATNMPGFCAENLPRWAASWLKSASFPDTRKENVSRVVIYDGFENYERAFARGKGVLFLTAHFGGWELSAFVHSLHGHWMHVVMRNLDNVYLDRLIQRYRSMHGNATVSKDNFVRGLLAAMKAGEVVGILMDTNMTPPQGVFVDFFGIPACTASGLARIALRTDAAVVPTSRSGIPPCGNTACDLIRRSNWCAPGTTRKISSPTPNCLPRLLKIMCAAIPTSGYGFTGAGRQDPQESQACTENSSSFWLLASSEAQF